MSVLSNLQIWIKCHFPWIVDRKACANIIDPDHMSQITLFHQGLCCFPFTQQCFEQSIGTGKAGTIYRIID